MRKNIAKRSSRYKSLTDPSRALLPAHMFLAIEMKYEGATYPEISVSIQEKYGMTIAPNTIRWWFCKNGMMRTLYDAYAQSENEARVNISRNLFKAHLDKAQAALMRAMQGRGGPAAVMAAKEWLDRALGKVAQSDEVVTTHVFTLADLVEEEYRSKEIEAENNGGTIAETNRSSETVPGKA